MVMDVKVLFIKCKELYTGGQNTDESRVVRKMAMANESDTKEMRELCRFLREHRSRQREQQEQ